MFNVSKIQTNLYGVVGWRQPLNPTYAVLDASNIASRSGEYVTNNPNCKIEYLYDNQDYSGLSDAEFNTVLKQMQEESIASICHQVFQRPDFITRQVLFPYANNKVATETMPAGLVAFKIQVSQEKNVAFEITRIALEFQGAGDVKLMLFNTAQSAPLLTHTETITSEHQVVELNWRVDNSGNTYKGEYYLGYRTNDPAFGTLKPFQREYENSDIKSNITFMAFDEYVFTGHATDTLPDLDDEDTIDQALGLNPDITVFYDFTDLITQNEMLLAHAINLDLQIKCLEVYIASLRDNINERKSELQVIRLIQEIEGVNETQSSVRVTGLRPQLSRAISRIKKEIDKLDQGYNSTRIMVDTLK